MVPGKVNCREGRKSLGILTEFSFHDWIHEMYVK